MGFRWLGRMSSRRVPVRLIQGDVSESVCVIATHPDDETIAAGGVMRAHLDVGHSVQCVVVTDGRRSRAGGLSPDAMARTRRQELDLAMKGLDVPYRHLDMEEGKWEAAFLEARLPSLLFGVTLLYAPCLLDYHPEHLRVAKSLSRIVDPEARVRMYPGGIPLGAALENCVVDIARYVHQKERALDAYTSQLGSVRTARRMMLYAKEWYGTPVELFCELTGAEYRGLATDLSDGPPLLHAMSEYPYMDPLVYLRSDRRGMRRRGWK